MFIGKADSLSGQQLYDSAKLYYEKAALAYLHEHDTVNFLKARLQEINTLARQIKNDECEELTLVTLQQISDFGFNAYEMQARLHQRLGIIYEIRDGDYLKSLKSYKSAYSALEKAPDRSVMQAILKTDMAIIYLGYQLYDSAQVALNEAIMFLKQHFPLDYSNLSDNYRILGIKHIYALEDSLVVPTFNKSMRYLMKDSASDRRELGRADIYSNLYSYYSGHKYLDSAIYYLQAERKINEKLLTRYHPSLALLYNNMGQLYFDLGWLDSARLYTEKALNLRKAKLKDEHPDLAHSYSSMATLLTEQGKLEAAKTYRKKAISIFEKAKSKSSREVLQELSSFANIHLVDEEYEESLSILEEVIKMRQAKGQTDAFTIRDYLGKTVALHKLGRYKEALETCLHSITLSEEIYGPNHETRARALIHLGGIYQQLNFPDKARRALLQARALILELLGPRHPKYSEALFLLSSLNKDEGKYQEALGLIEKAMIANSYSLDSLELTENVPLGDMVTPLAGLNHMVAKAELFYDQYLQTMSDSLLEQSFHQYAAVIGTLKELLFDIDNEKDINRLMAVFHNSYERILAILVRLNDNTQWRQEGYIHSFLAYSDESKALGIMVNRYRNNREKLDQSTRVFFDRLTRVNSAIAFNKSAIQTKLQKKNPENITYHQNRIFKLTEEKLEIQNKLQKQSGEFSDFKNSSLLIDLKAIQAGLIKEEAVIQYKILDSILLTTLITGDTLVTRKQKLDSTFYSQIDLFSGIHKRDLSQYIPAAFELYNTLISRIKNEIGDKTHLIILKDKELWKIQFDLLLDKPPTASDPRSFSYLLKTYQVSYIYSLGLLFGETRHHKPSKNILAMAYERPIPSQSFPKPQKTIRGTSREVLALRDQYEGDFIFEQEANEKLFKENADQYSILNLALHGQLDDTDIDKSSLVFNQLTDSTSEDGFLYPFEIYSMKLNADMAVLSACYSGAGAIVNGAGAMSMGRAFYSAGVNSLLLSQWEASDGTAPEIIGSFYKHLSKGHNKAAALRLAKLEYLKNSDSYSSNPYFWGNYYLLGSSHPISIKSNDQWRNKVLLTVVVIMALGTYLFYWAKRQKNDKSS